MEKVESKHEYLHNPRNIRLWNESYYFHFNGRDAKGFIRLGFQPYERRANVWYYVVDEGGIYWFRDENIPISATHGLNVDAGDFRLSLEPVRPHEEWTITARGQCNVSDSAWSLIVGTDSKSSVNTELTFHEPRYHSRTMELFGDNQSHYEQTGLIEGTISHDHSGMNIRTSGARDHSWGWFRDFTPGSWGHVWGAISFDGGDCVHIVAIVNPEGNFQDSSGFLFEDATWKRISNVGIMFDDDLPVTERAETWAREGCPDTITLRVELDDRTEKLRCTPTDNVPIGYEDRNWELIDIHSPWLKSIFNRMAVECKWGSDRGSGWVETIQPMN